VYVWTQSAVALNRLFRRRYNVRSHKLQYQSLNQISLALIWSHHFYRPNLFIFMLFLLEGRTNEAWESSNKLMLSSFPYMAFFSFLPFFVSSFIVYIVFSLNSKNWNTCISKSSAVCLHGVQNYLDYVLRLKEPYTCSTYLTTDGNSTIGGRQGVTTVFVTHCWLAQYDMSSHSQAL
jgi:hypothetical protein